MHVTFEPPTRWTRLCTPVPGRPAAARRWPDNDTKEAFAMRRSGVRIRCAQPVTGLGHEQQRILVLPLRARQRRPLIRQGTPIWFRSRLRAQCRARLRTMRGITHAIFGVFAFVLAGFVRGGLRYSADPELVLAASWGLAAFGLFGVLVGGVAIGIQLSRK